MFLRFHTNKIFTFFQSCETTWVIEDHVNSPSCPGELSVTRGQQVEVIDLPSPTTAFVRLVAPNSNSTNSAFAKPTASLTSSNANSGDQTTNNQNCSVEGTVPISCLKRPPSGFRSQNDIAGKFKQHF